VDREGMIDYDKALKSIVTDWVGDMKGS
jgi:hypothetical protein